MSKLVNKHRSDCCELVPVDGRYSLIGGAFFGDHQPPGIDETRRSPDDSAEEDDGRYGWTLGE